MAAPVTMTVNARGTIPRSVVRAAEGFHGEMEQYDGMEMELANPGHQYDHPGQQLATQPQHAPHGERCSCCPYGYHIDLDFLRYCESLNNGSYLRNLKKIKKNKKKLRKSMEVFLNGQHQPDGGGLPPDVVHSTETFMNYREHEDIADRRLLDDFDATVDNIDLLNHQRRRGYKGSGDYDEPDNYFDDYDSSSPGPGYDRRNFPPNHGYVPSHDPKYRTETEMVLHQPRKSDSVSSLTSSVSEPGSHPSSGDGYRTTVTETEKRYKTQTHTYITSAQLAGQFAELMPEQRVPAIASTPESSVSPEALKAIREQMAKSLLRLHELEEQVKIIPVLQVRLSVLKEEKRLHELQMHTRNNNMRSVGVGDCCIDDYDRSRSSSPSTRMFEMTEFQSFNRKNIRRPARSIGCGDGNVFEQQQIALRQQRSWQDNQVHERELHTEESSHITEREKEVHTLVIGQEQNRLASIKRGEQRIPTRSIGVGNSNVFDTSSNLHVHEKEMRTVIIGGDDRQKKQYRNVGVSCRATMRDVGVMYYYENAKPNTRNVAVGVGEGMMVGEFAENGSEETSVHNTLTSLQQINMAAFHTKNINIKSEHLRIILDQMLKKTVKSVGTMCKMATEDKATNHVGYDMVNVGCGADRIDVDIRQKVTTRSIGVENRPAVMNRAMLTVCPRLQDVGINTKRTQIVHRATNTHSISTFPATTNTEMPRVYSVMTETDSKIFQALDQVRNTGTNTSKIYTMNSETNTENQGRNLHLDSFTDDITLIDKGMNTTNMKHTSNRSVNTERARMCNMGVGENNINQHVDCDICLVEPQTKTTTKTTTITEQKPKKVHMTVVEEQDQQTNSEVMHHTESSSPSRYSREITIESRMLDRKPMQTISTETESHVRSARRSSPIGMTQDQIMEHHLGRNSGNFEEIADELQTQLSSGNSAVTKQVTDQSDTGMFSREVTIESRSGRIGQPLTVRGSGMSTHEVSEQVLEKTVRTPPKVAPKPSRQIITESQSQSSTFGGGTGGLREAMFDARIGGGQSSTTETTETTETIVQSRVRGGQNIIKDISVESRLGASSGSSVRCKSEDSLSSKSGSTILTRDYDSEDGGTNFLTREVIAGGYVGGSQISPSSVTATELSSTRSYIENKTAGGVIVERKPSREERMRHYGLTGLKGYHVQSIAEKEAEAKMQSSGSSTSMSSSASSLSSSTSVSTVKSASTSSLQSVSPPSLKASSNSSLRSGSTSSSLVKSGVISGSSSSGAPSSLVKSGVISGSSSSGASSSLVKSEVISGSSSSGGSSSLVMSGVISGSSSSGAPSSLVKSGVISGSSSSGASSSLVKSGVISGSSSSGASSSLVKSGVISGSSSSGAGSNSDIQFLPDGKGGTQMRVVRHTETSYVGNQPVHSKSDVVLGNPQSGSMSSSNQQQRAVSSSFSSSSSSSSATSSSSTAGDAGRTITVTETKIERHGAPVSLDDDGQGSLRSIMKKPGSSPIPAKKGIKFAEEVSAGFELSPQMTESCTTYSNWLHDSMSVNTKQLNSAINLIQQDWFKISSEKLSNPSQVEDFCSSFKEFSPELLTQIVNMTDANGNSALHYAVSHCNTDVVNLLLESGALDIDKQNKAGYTAVMLASLATVTTQPQRQAIGRLFQLGNVNARASQAGQTALMLAVSHGRTDMVGMLMECGANINVQDDDGSTALMCACEHGHTDIVKMLLGHSECDPTVADNDGSTALSIAMEAGHRDVGVLLYAHVNFKQGSPVLARSKYKRKPSSPTSPRLIKR